MPPAGTVVYSRWTKNTQPFAMPPSRHRRRGPSAGIWIAAAIACAFAGVGLLIVAGAGSTPIGQIMAVLVGLLLVVAGVVVAIGTLAPATLRQDPGDEWP